MRKRSAAFLPFVLIALCTAGFAAGDAYQVSQKLREDMPPFVFTLEFSQTEYSAKEAEQRSLGGESDLCYIHSIVISHEGTGGELQRIDLNPPAETFADQEYGYGLILEDMDFDGFVDMRVMQFVSAGVNIPYHCWLWSPVNQCFVYNETLSAVSSPIFDPLSRRVYGFETGGTAEYIDTTYEYRGADLELISRVTTGYDFESGTAIVTTEQPMDGEMVVTGVTREPLLLLDDGEFDW